MWRTVKLGDLCEVVTKGTTPTSVGFKFESEGINFVKVESLAADSTFINSKFAKVSSDCHEALKRSQLKEGDILFSIAGALGRTAIVTEDILPANTNQALAIVRIKETVEVDKRFLLYVLNSDSTKEQSDSNKGGVAQQNLSLTQLKNYRIILPPLAEQQRIVAKLDAAFTEIDRAIEIERQKGLYAEALESQAMSGWLAQHSSQNEVYKISEAVNEGWIQAPFDGNHGEIHPKAKDYVASGVPFLMASDIRNGHADMTNCKFLPRELADSLRKGFARNKDVLLTHKGTIGETAVLSCSIDYVMLTPQVTAYRVLNEGRVSRDFLYYQFKSEQFQRQLKEIAGIGTTRAYIGITRQKDLQLCIPPIQLQNEAVTLMRTIEPNTNLLEKVATEKIAQLSQLKSAILAQELQPPQSEAA